MINTHRHLATAAPLVSMHPRGNTDGGEPVAQGMDSHGGPWEPEKIVDTYHAWQQTLVPTLPRGNADGGGKGEQGMGSHGGPWEPGAGYFDVAGFCKSVDLDKIAKHDYVLTPGRYVGAVAEEDDGEPFADKMARLSAQLKTQFAESDKLEVAIKNNLNSLGYPL